MSQSKNIINWLNSSFVYEQDHVLYNHNIDNCFLFILLSLD